MKKLLENIRNKINWYREKTLKRKARDKMIKDYEMNVQGELILEQWVIKRILDGHTGRREELAKKQAQIKETSEFINYLKKTKI